jgi:hypothetical protein
MLKPAEISLRYLARSDGLRDVATRAGGYNHVFHIQTERHTGGEPALCHTSPHATTCGVVDLKDV